MTRDTEPIAPDTDHLDDDDLVLLHYGEPQQREGLDAGAHLAACAECQGRLAAMQRVLAEVKMPVPEPDPFLAARVWRAVEPQLTPRAAERPRRALRPGRLALAASLLVLALASYLAGRHGRIPVDESIPPEVRQRVLQVALLDHLERGRHLLTDLLNEEGAPVEAQPGAGAGETGPAASQPLDMTVQRQQAETLVAAGRIYRQTAAAAGETAVVALLDELERVMLEVAHGPEAMSAAELDALRLRLRDNGILLRVQMTATRMRGTRPQQPAQPGRPGHRI